MPYDIQLAHRVREALAATPRVTERRMFGGLAFMIDDRMAVGVLRDDLVEGVGPDAYEAALASRGARPMDFTRRPMRGFVFLGPEGVRTAAALRKWIERALAYDRVVRDAVGM